MLKSAQDESSHLMHEIGNVADSARRTAVKLRGRETGAEAWARWGGAVRAARSAVQHAAVALRWLAVAHGGT